jgi:hypothetical protein
VRFLLDQDVYSSTARFLEDLGHDVVSAAQIGLSLATDEVLPMDIEKIRKIVG